MLEAEVLMEKSFSEEYKGRSIFRNKNFMLLFTGKLVSQFGDVIYNMAIGWYILTITSSAVQMSIYMAIGTVVYIAIGPFGGVIADRFDRKSIIIWMDIIRGIAVAVTGILMYFNVTSIYIFYVASTILSICGAVFVPASNAMIPGIVEESQLTKANSLGSSVGSVSGIVGTITGGILYALLGIKIIFILNAVSYIICGVLEVFIKIPAKDKAINEDNAEINRNIFKELSSTYRYMKEQRGMFILMWFSTIINLLAAPLIAVFVPYIFNQILRVSTEQYSYVGAASAVGMLIGAGILTFLPQREKISSYVRFSLTTFSVLFISMFVIMAGYSKGLVQSYLVVILFTIIFLIFGIASALLNIPTGVFIQRVVPNEMLGRVSSLVNTLVMAAMPLGMLIGGAAADVMPMNILLFTVSIVFCVITLYLSYQKDIRKI